MPFVTVAAYRRYCEIMARSAGLGMRDTAECMGDIISAVIGGISRHEVGLASAADVWQTVKLIHFVMQDIIAPKFLELSPGASSPEGEYVGSAFDAYDAENGYNDEPDTTEGDVWRVMVANTDQLVRFAIKAMGESYSTCMSTDIYELLDYAKFEFAAIKDEKK